MNKFHYFIITLTFVIYGFIFYQKYYAGPDEIDYFRDKGNLLSEFIDEPDKYLGKKYKLYSEYKPKGLPDYFDNSYIIYFKKNKKTHNLKCVSDYVEINGVIQRSIENKENYFYYSKIESIYGYDDGKSNPNDKGKKIKCYSN